MRYDILRHMKRTTIFIDSELERDLRLYAERQGRSTASVVREALAQWVVLQRTVPKTRPGFVATGGSGHADTAERAEELVFGALDPHGGSRTRGPALTRRPAGRPPQARRQKPSSR